MVKKRLILFAVFLASFSVVIFRPKSIVAVGTTICAVCPEACGGKSGVTVPGPGGSCGTATTQEHFECVLEPTPSGYEGAFKICKDQNGPGGACDNYEKFYYQGNKLYYVEDTTWATGNCQNVTCQSGPYVGEELKLVRRDASDPNKPMLWIDGDQRCTSSSQVLKGVVEKGPNAGQECLDAPFTNSGNPIAQQICRQEAPACLKLPESAVGGGAIVPSPLIYKIESGPGAGENYIYYYDGGSGNGGWVGFTYPTGCPSGNFASSLPAGVSCAGAQNFSCSGSYSSPPGPGGPGGTSGGNANCGFNIRELTVLPMDQILNLLNYARSCQNCPGNNFRIWGYRDANKLLALLQNAPAGTKFTITLSDYYEIPKGPGDDPEQWYRDAVKPGSAYLQYVQNIANQIKAQGLGSRVYVFEPMNEANCSPRVSCWDAEYNFFKVTSELIKSISSSFQVSTGLQGQQTYGEQFDVNGVNYYERIASLPTIDINSCHIYPDEPNNSVDNCKRALEISKRLGKKFFISEAGARGPRGSGISCSGGNGQNACSTEQLKQRAAELMGLVYGPDAPLKGVDEFSLWQLNPPATPASRPDAFSIYPGDPICDSQINFIPPPVPGGPSTQPSPGGQPPVPQIGDVCTTEPIEDPDHNDDYQTPDALGAQTVDEAKRLIDYGGETDPNAPKFNSLVVGQQFPSINETWKIPGEKWPVTQISLGAAGAQIAVPSAGYRIDAAGHQVMVVKATNNSIVLKYTREDNAANGYTLVLSNLTVNSAVVRAYTSLANRNSLPSLFAGHLLGIAGRGGVQVAIRDKGMFMDPRSRKDWWTGDQIGSPSNGPVDSTAVNFSQDACEPAPEAVPACAIRKSVPSDNVQTFRPFPCKNCEKRLPGKFMEISAIQRDNQQLITVYTNFRIRTRQYGDRAKNFILNCADSDPGKNFCSPRETCFVRNWGGVLQVDPDEAQLPFAGFGDSDKAMNDTPLLRYLADYIDGDSYYNGQAYDPKTLEGLVAAFNDGGVLRKLLTGNQQDSLKRKFIYRSARNRGWLPPHNYRLKASYFKPDGTRGQVNALLSDFLADGLKRMKPLPTDFDNDPDPFAYLKALEAWTHLDPIW